MAVRIGKFLLLVIRWWFATVWIGAAVGGLVAVPVMALRGNYGWVYMLVGAPIIGYLGWVVHPWGMERRNARRALAR